MYKITKLRQYLRHFPIKLALLKISISVIEKCLWPKLTGCLNWLYARKHRVVLTYLTKNNQALIEDWLDTSDEPRTGGEDPSREIIWVCWWQGEEAAPDLVKACINSIRKNANNHPVVLLTKDNYRTYVEEFPTAILAKVSANQLSVTHLSDLLRMRILYKYGGLWLDSTVFVSKPIPQRIFNRHIYSISEGATPGEDLRYIPQGKWVSSILGGQPGHPLFGLGASILSESLTKQQSIVDYFFLDYTLQLGYENISSCYSAIKMIPSIGYPFYGLQERLNDTYDEAQITALLSESKGNVFFKLSNKTKHEVTKDQRLTVYGWLLAGYLDR